MQKKFFYFVLFLTVCFNSIAVSQFIEDALRFSQPNNGTGARALGLGNAYIGVADDFTSVWWNPAGLGQIKKFEFTTGFSNFNYNDDASFLGNNMDYSTNATNLNNLGFVIPFPTVRGSLVFAIGYNRTNMFTSGMSFDGFNTRSSMINYLARQNSDLTYETYLTDETGLYTPITKNVQQTANILESGSLGHWAFSGALEVAPDLFVGLSLYITTGSYNYDKNYEEADTRNYYTYFDDVNYTDIDFDRFELRDIINGDYTGVGAQLGVMYKFKDLFRIGATIKTPFTHYIEEDWSSNARSYFDNGESFSHKIIGKSKYNVVTPYVFGLGFGWSYMGFLLSGDFEWIDYTQMEFSNANNDVMELNRDIRTDLQSVFNLRLGLEYTIPNIELKLRGGFGLYPSPFKGDPSDYDRNIISFGLGYLVAESLMIDAAYAINSFTTKRVNYDSTSETLEKVKANSLLVSLSFRF
jgi:long-subunit fatty acid transport protein